MRRIDAHHHFWEHGRGGLAWLTSGREPLAHSYGPAEFGPELAAARVDATVLVQAANSADETHRVLDAAASTDYVAGAVVWVPLHLPEETAATLQRCRSHTKFRGVRYITTPGSDVAWLLEGPAVESLRLVAKAGAALDVVPAEPAQLRAVIELAHRIPQLDIVIDHLGRPPLPERGWQPWASLMTEAAACPRVHVKLSVGLDVLDHGWQWSADGLRRYAEHVIACFGPRRVMAASNWPVSLIGATYRDVWATVETLVAPLPPPDRHAILATTAAEFYGLRCQGGEAR